MPNGWAASLTKRLADESRARAAACAREHREQWVVITRHGNYSAFAGYRFTPSDYSALRCGGCGRVWRTRAGYVDQVPDDFRGEFTRNHAAISQATAAAAGRDTPP